MERNLKCKFVLVFGFSTALITATLELHEQNLMTMFSSRIWDVPRTISSFNVCLCSWSICTWSMTLVNIYLTSHLKRFIFNVSKALNIEFISRFKVVSQTSGLCSPPALDGSADYGANTETSLVWIWLHLSSSVLTCK